jgi:DNA repair protein RecN (Recombination protein N)
MLRFLSIERLAIIDAVTLEFGRGLTVLTGETGAGKSIVVGAVELLLGGRASSDLVRSGEENANIQAVLETADGRDIIVRRELFTSGRSRAFIDGNMVTNAGLREVTAPLLDLHGQHDHQTLLDPQSHLRLIDEYGGHDALLADVEKAYDAWSAVRQRLAASRIDARERAARLELINFHLGEIERAAPRPGEDDALTAERLILANADRVHRMCREAYDDLYDAEGAVLERLSRVWRRVGELATLDPSFADVASTRQSIEELQDLAHRLRDLMSRLDVSPERLQAVEDRLAALERLKRRHGPTLADVLEKGSTLAAERDALSMDTDQAAALQRQVDGCRARFLAAAELLSTARRGAARRFASELATELVDLAMPDARCEVRFGPESLPEPRWSATGVDEGELYLSANLGEDLRPLARIASGGELSRIMLGVKTLASIDGPGKTLIFDEVDAGIGGRAADAVGARLQRLGKTFQVLCITHLPQVAAHADAHYVVSKSVQGGRTLTRVSPMTGEGRVEELARMMAGGTGIPAVLDGARDLLSARTGKNTAKGESERAKAKAVQRPRSARSS